MESELLYSVPPSDVRLSVAVNAAALHTDFWGLRLFTDAYFALQPVASGIEAQTHTERQTTQGI